MVFMYKIAIYFNAETQGRRVRRGSWSLELELESGGLGVRSQESGVRGWIAALAAERKSERMDTAYSPRLHEEELSATANWQFINLLSPIRMGRPARQGTFRRR